MGEASPQGQRPARPVFPPAPTTTQRLGAVFAHPFDQSHLHLGTSAMTRRASAHQRSPQRAPRCASTCACPRKALLATAVVVELASACAWRLCSPRSRALHEDHMQRPHGVCLPRNTIRRARPACTMSFLGCVFGGANISMFTFVF